MKPADNPFVLARVTCPVCRTVNEFEQIKPGAFSEEGSDTDFRPLGRHWRNPRYQEINPLLYFMATCSSCFFTREFNRAFREWSNSPDFAGESQAVLRQKHLNEIANVDGVMRRLGSTLWPASYPMQTAINKLLLGVRDEELLSRPSAHSLARWYLRVAWLFRELAQSQSAETLSPAAFRRRRFLEGIEELENNLRHLAKSCADLNRMIMDFPESAQGHPDDHDGISQTRNLLSQFSEQVGRLSLSLVDMREGSGSDPGPLFGAAANARPETFGDAASYSSFLRGLKMDWPGVPVNEEEAMARSLLYHKRALGSDGSPAPAQGGMMTAYMIGELARRLGNWEEARQYLAIARDAAREAVTFNGSDRPETALARHIAALSENQMERLYDASTAP